MPTTVTEIAFADGWVQVASGACLIESRDKVGGRVHFGDVAPAADTEAYHDLSPRNPMPYGGAENAFVRAAYEGYPINVIVTEGV